MTDLEEDGQEWSGDLKETLELHRDWSELFLVKFANIGLDYIVHSNIEGNGKAALVAELDKN